MPRSLSGKNLERSETRSGRNELEWKKLKLIRPRGQRPELNYLIILAGSLERQKGDKNEKDADFWNRDFTGPC